MKYILLLMLGTPLFAFSQISKSITQTFNINDAESLSVNLNSSNIQIKYTKGSRILVETTIETSLDNPPLLEFLVQQGRYDLNKEYNPNTRSLSLFNKKKEKDVIIVKGKQLEEELTYIIYVPNKLAIFTANGKK